MGRKGYSKEFLISELHRFVRENGRVPTKLDMSLENGYPSSCSYQNHFGSFNNALEIVGLEINRKRRKLDGTETCSHCGKRANEIVGHISWRYDENSIRFCQKHGNSGVTGGKPDYVKGQLDINCPKGRGRAGEICVVKALKIGDEHDCALISMGYPFDLYHEEEYGRIDVKTSLLSNVSNKWHFNFPDKLEIKTFICIGMSLDTKYVKYVWIVSNEGEIRDLTGLGIYDTYGSLRNHKKLEVDSKIYDDAWQDMLINYTDGKCKVFGKKEQNIYIKPIKIIEQTIDKNQFTLEAFM